MRVWNFLAGYLRDLTAFALAFVGAFLLLLISIGIVNSDLYGKRTETHAVRFVDAGPTSPTVLLVLHRIMPDQNAVEASVILTTSDSNAMNAIRAGKLHLSAIVRDGTGVRPYALRNEVALSPAAYQPGDESMAAESARFFLPTQPTIGTYPFDDVSVGPIVKVFRMEDASYPKFSLHVQKALPGRLLAMHEQSSIPSITLTRPMIHKALVTGVALIFLSFTAVFTFELFRASNGLSSLQELLAVAGFLVTTAGFRDILGFSRLPTTCALEFIIDVPIVLISFGVAVSLKRRHQHAVTPSASDGPKTNN